MSSSESKPTMEHEQDSGRSEAVSHGNDEENLSLTAIKEKLAAWKTVAEERKKEYGKQRAMDIMTTLTDIEAHRQCLQNTPLDLRSERRWYFRRAVATAEAQGLFISGSSVERVIADIRNITAFLAETSKPNEEQKRLEDEMDALMDAEGAELKEECGRKMAGVVTRGKLLEELRKGNEEVDALIEVLQENMELMEEAENEKIALTGYPPVDLVEKTLAEEMEGAKADNGWLKHKLEYVVEGCNCGDCDDEDSTE